MIFSHNFELVVNENMKKYGTNSNENKTEYMVITSRQKVHSALCLTFTQIWDFKYLGVNTNDKNFNQDETKCGKQIILHAIILIKLFFKSIVQCL